MIKLKKQDNLKEAEAEIERIDVDSTYIKVSTWIEKYGSLLPYVGIALIALLIFTYRFLSVGENAALADYQRADLAYQQLLTSPGDTTNLEKLALLTEAHPELNAKYDAFLAELFFAHNQNAKGIPLANNILKRTTGLTATNFHSFTAATVSIEKDDFDNALVQAEQLEENLASDPQQETLRAFNLLRISTLYRHAGQQQKSAEAWKSYSQNISDATKRKIAASFQLGNASLEGFFTLEKVVTK